MAWFRLLASQVLVAMVAVLILVAAVAGLMAIRLRAMRQLILVEEEVEAVPPQVSMVLVEEEVLAVIVVLSLLRPPRLTLIL
jgi:hypothetical protein